MSDSKHEELRKRIAKKLNSPFKGRAKSPEHRKKLAAHWDSARRNRQAEIAKKTNEVDNLVLRNYLCPTCGMEFEQVSKVVYGGHRKTCLYWKEVEEWLEEDEVATIEAVLDPTVEPSE